MAEVKIFENRKDMLQALLPKGGKIAEIGIFKGDFSQWINDTIQPEEFVLIDPFDEVILGSGDQDGYNMEFYNGKMLHWYNTLRFRACKNVKLERKRSDAYFATVADGYFDAIYIDGDHSPDGVRIDLEISRKKVKENGWIFGHDYERHPTRGNPDVRGSTKEVVDQFCKKYNLEIVAFAHDGFISYAIRNTKKARVCICSFSDRKELYSVTYPRLEEYSKKHGYTFRPFHTHLVNTQTHHPSWNKMFVLKAVIEENAYDYVWWIDDDIYITDVEKPVMDFLEKYEFTTNQKQFLVCEDLDNRKVAFNCGMMLMKSNKVVYDILNLILRISENQPMLHKNFSWEQEAFGFFYRFITSDPFQIIPHRTLQSMCRPFDCGIDEGWNVGDFAAHVSAGEVSQRLKIIHLLKGVLGEL
jgi:hypothetical protein